MTIVISRTCPICKQGFYLDASDVIWPDHGNLLAQELIGEGKFTKMRYTAKELPRCPAGGQPIEADDRRALLPRADGQSEGTTAR